MPEGKPPDATLPLSLGPILSASLKGCLTQCQHYDVGLRLGSSVAQLRFIPCVRTGLSKEAIHLFPVRG